MLTVAYINFTFSRKDTERNTISLEIIMQYPVIIRPNDEGYTITLPDFPGCEVQGSNMGELQKLVQAAVEKHMQDGKPIPPATDIARVAHYEEAEEGMVTMIEVDFGFLE